MQLKPKQKLFDFLCAPELEVVGPGMAPCSCNLSFKIILPFSEQVLCQILTCRCNRFFEAMQAQSLVILSLQ